MVYALPADVPKPGDIILRSMNDASHRYALSTTGDVPQIACTTFAEAIARADAFALSHKIDVWHTDDGRVFTRIVEARLWRP
jgi:hypothetical protein